MNYNIIVFFFFGMVCSAQKADYGAILKRMDSLNQVKLDTGLNMMSTERSYFLNLRTFMNEVYDDLLESQTSPNLVKEQKDWMEFFDQKSLEMWNSINETEELGLDARMIAYGKQTALLRKRILELIDQF